MAEDERLIRKEELPEETSDQAIRSADIETAEICNPRNPCEILPNRLVTQPITTTTSTHQFIMFIKK
jgi:hypothetical protein